MEETIGYEAAFPTDEWNELDLIEDEELELAFGDQAPDGEAVDGIHSCTIYDPPGELAGNDNRFEIECERCGLVGAADNRIEAKAISRLHEAFVATLADKWTIEKVVVEPHKAFVVPEDGHFEIICSRCGDVGSADDRSTAEMLKRFHDNAFELAGKAAS